MLATKENNRGTEKKNTCLETSFIQNQKKKLNNSSSAAQFLSRSRGKNSSFQLPQSNGLELSLNKLLFKSPSVIKQIRSIRSSKSCGKNFGLVSDLKEQFETLQMPDRAQMLYNSIKAQKNCPRKGKLISKKASAISKGSIDVSLNNKTVSTKKSDLSTIVSRYKTSPKTLYGTAKNISENKIFQTICKVNPNSKPQRGTIKNKFVSRNQRTLTSEAIHYRPQKGDIEPNLEIDSATVITATTTAHTAMQDLIKYMECAKTLNKNLTKVLKEIDQNCSHLSAIEQHHQRAKAAKAKMEEACAIMPHFKELLKRVVFIIEEQGIEQAKKARNELEKKSLKYDEEICILNQKLVNQEELLKLQSKEQIDKLNQKDTIIEKLKLTISELKKQLTQYLFESDPSGKPDKSPTKAEELAEEFQILYGENKKLGLIAKKLYGELQASKKREASLVNLLKGGSKIEIKQFDQSKGQKQKNKKMIEAGRRKVKIPALDFSKLPTKKPAKLKVIDYHSKVEKSGIDVMIVDEESLNESEMSLKDFQNEEASESVDNLMQDFLLQMGENSDLVISDINQH